jgi:hypothetical protein
MSISTIAYAYVDMMSIYNNMDINLSEAWAQNLPASRSYLKFKKSNDQSKIYIEHDFYIKISFEIKIYFFEICFYCLDEYKVCLSNSFLHHSILVIFYS